MESLLVTNLTNDPIPSIPPAATSAQNIKPPTDNTKRGEKRKLNNKRKNANAETNGKNKQAKFSKKPETNISSVRPINSVFELMTSFIGIRYIAQSFYEILRSRDSKMTNLFSELEFYYVLQTSVIYRCATIANRCKQAFIPRLSDMKTLIEGLLIPDSLATYVETFGIVKLVNGANVCPYFRNHATMTQTVGFVGLTQTIRLINNERAELNLPPYNTYDEWGLCPDIILKYANASSRALKNAMELRYVDFGNMDGRPEFLTCYSVDDDHVKCLAIDKVDNAQCQLGASYRLRTPEMIAEGGTNFPILFAADPIRPAVHLNTHFLRGMRP